MGLDIYLIKDGKEIGYIRSSYNDFGLSRWMKANFGISLFDMLDESGIHFEEMPSKLVNWKKFKETAEDLLSKAKSMSVSYLYIQERPIPFDDGIEEGGVVMSKGGIVFGDEKSSGIEVIEVRSCKHILGGFGICMVVILRGEEHKAYVSRIENLVKFAETAIKNPDAKVVVSG